MGFYRQSCSPYEVQQRQGGRFTFTTVKDRYENTTPLRGKRKADNIRPINRRDRSFERIVKVSDNEYYVTFDGYKFRTNHNKAITWQMRDGMEYMTVHTPRKTWSSTDPHELYPRYLSSASTLWFYDFNMPIGFSMVNHYVNKYVRYNDKHYSIELGDIVFQRKEGESHWQPLVVHRQFKHHIDREQTKQLKQSIKPFLDYFDIMCDVVEPKYDYGNTIKASVSPENQHKATPDMVWEVFKPSDTIPDAWLLMVERYKRTLTYSKRLEDGTWSSNKTWREDLPKELLKDLYEAVKPCKEIEVPLGELCVDRYKSWYR
jgi:hypothetical protein